MKKVILAAAVVCLSLTACTTITKTATSIEVPTAISSQSVADLNVSSSRVSYTYRPTSDERRGGTQNVINCAIQAALKANGGGDVLVAPEYSITKKSGLFGGKKVKEVVVSGYPATYKNFRSVTK